MLHCYVYSFSCFPLQVLAIGGNTYVDISFLKISVCGLGYWFNSLGSNNRQKFKIGLQVKRKLLLLLLVVVVVGPCHHGMARPQVADRGTASNMEGSCE